MPDNSPEPAPSPRPPISVRLAESADLPAINDIYNFYVRESTCTYQESPDSLLDRQAWFAKHGESHPVTVAVDESGKVVGWGSLSPFHPRSAYRFTTEDSVYLHPEVRGKGIGKVLLADLIERARAKGHQNIIALIDAGQAGSIVLHRRFGFEQVGHLKRVGFKFGQWLDVVYMQVML